jgi:hypothetical protein
MPKKLADSENNALTTPMTFTGTAAELDEQYKPCFSTQYARSNGGRHVTSGESNTYQ